MKGKWIGGMKACIKDDGLSKSLGREPRKLVLGWMRARQGENTW